MHSVGCIVLLLAGTTSVYAQHYDEETVRASAASLDMSQGDDTDLPPVAAALSTSCDGAD